MTPLVRGKKGTQMRDAVIWGRFAMSAHQKTVVLRRLQVFKSHSEPWLQPHKGVFRQNHENDLNLPRGSEKQFFNSKTCKKWV